MPSNHPFIESVKTALEQAGADRQQIQSEFWLKVKNTPLIQSNPDDPNTKIVTFLWQGKISVPHISNIYLGSLGTDLSRILDKNKLENIPGTDIHFLTVQLPNTLRMSYFYYQNDPHDPYQSKFDCRNPNVLDRASPDEPPGLGFSILKMPGAPVQNFISSPHENKTLIEVNTEKVLQIKNEGRLLEFVFK